MRPTNSSCSEAAERPEIVCLCGSTRFFKTFDEQNFRLTLDGKIVLSIGCNTKSDEGLMLTAVDKARLDELHKRKIDLADSILVLNVGGYIGDSTRSEIEYARAHGKPVEFLERGLQETEEQPQRGMTMKLFKAKLHTGGKTREQIVDKFQAGVVPSEKEISESIAYYNLLDGATVIVTDHFKSEGYILVHWPEEEHSRMKEAIYLLEQDALFGMYIDQRDEFDADWDAGDYSPDGTICFDAAEVEIIEAISVATSQAGGEVHDDRNHQGTN